MKVYLFDTQNGLYHGETFEAAEAIHYEEGITPVPPPSHGYGQVPVFDRQKNQWTLIPISIARQLLNGNGSNSRENLP